MRRCTSGAFLFASLSCGELDAACTPFPTSSGCSGAGGVGGGEGVEDGEDWGVSESVMGEEPDSDTEVVSDSNPLESRWSNLNTSYSVISKSSPAPWQKIDGGDEQRGQPASGLLNLHPYDWFVLTTVCYVNHAVMFCRVADHNSQVCLVSAELFPLGLIGYDVETWLYRTLLMMSANPLKRQKKPNNIFPLDSDSMSSEKYSALMISCKGTKCVTIHKWKPSFKNAAFTCFSSVQNIASLYKLVAMLKIYTI